jgi:hypothetical protein
MTNAQRHLPEPGVDVYIKLAGERTARLARIGTDRDTFITPSFTGWGQYSPGGCYRVMDVVEWDYAVPAGDLLC